LRFKRYRFRITYSVQTIQSLTAPAFTQLSGINNTGAIAGFYGAIPAQAFTLTWPNTFIGQNFPGSVQTMATAINNFGNVAGIYMDAGRASHAYFRNVGGVFTTMDQPGQKAYR